MPTFDVDALELSLQAPCHACPLHEKKHEKQQSGLQLVRHDSLVVCVRKRDTRFMAASTHLENLRARELLATFFIQSGWQGRVLKDRVHFRAPLLPV